MLRAAFLFFFASRALADDGSLLLPLPRAHFHERVSLPLRGFEAPAAEAAAPQRLLLVADSGHGAARSASSICGLMADAFSAGALNASHCRASVASSVRAARGHALQHGEGAAAAVLALESYLGEEGHSATEWVGAAGSWDHPYRSRFLQGAAARLAGARAPGAPGALPNACVVGFGAGHTAALLLAAGGGESGGGDGASRLRVLSFDKATNRAAVPASDFLDVRFPEKSALFLGEPSAALERFRVAFPDMRCSLLVLDPHPQQPLAGNATAQVLRALRAVAAPGHVLVLAGGRAEAAPGEAAGAGAAARPGAPLPPPAAAAPVAPGAVWRQAAEAGWISWEGTLLEAPLAADGDSLLYGELSLGDAPWEKLPVEQTP
jgi:hypothetical protein